MAKLLMLHICRHSLTIQHSPLVMDSGRSSVTQAPSRNVFSVDLVCGNEACYRKMRLSMPSRSRVAAERNNEATGSRDGYGIGSLSAEAS